MTVPDSRIRAANDADLRPEGRYVLYWCTSARRTTTNPALERAADLAERLGRPLLFLEPLRVGYRWASHRLHRFVIEGMADNRAALAGGPVRYLPYVEDRAGAGNGLLEALGRHACAVVGDDYPCFFLPRMLAAAAERLDVRLELVDGNGLYPMRAVDRTFTRAFSFRRHLQKELLQHIEPDVLPRTRPLARRELEPFDDALLPGGFLDRWPAADLDALLEPDGLDDLPIDASVEPVETVGGAAAAHELLEEFVTRRLSSYGDGRNHPDDDAASRLSPYLHFGHLSSLEVFGRLVRDEEWSRDAVRAAKVTGARSGWWQLPEPVEAFLDQLVTWRELGFNMCATHDEFDRYESLPAWARETLAEHEGDERPHVYDLETFRTASTHDLIWNAAQRQLVRTGRMHNYLRMLWGKKILHWSPDPRTALDVMIELNNRYALDGRDPNSYSGIFWTLGRYDRAWGPERPVFGKIRYMTSDSTRRKLRLTEYLEEFGERTLFD